MAVRALMKKPSRIPRAVLSRLRGPARRAKAGSGSVLATAAYERWTAPIGPVTPSSPAGPTIVLLNDCRDQINFGANALVDGLVASLAHALPTATILPIPSYWLIEGQYLHTFVGAGEGMRQPRVKFPALADQFEAVADDWMAGRGGRDAREYLSRFERADVVVVNGEASLYARNQSGVRELFLAWLCKTRLGIPTIFVNGTVHLTDVFAILPPMVRKVLPALDAVAVREAPSLRNLRQFAPDVDAKVVADSAFLISPDEARTTPAVEKIRAQLGEGPYFYFDPGAMPIDVRGGERSALHQLISALKRVTPRAVFVSTGPVDSYIEAMAQATDSLYVDTIVDYREWMALIAGAEFLVTGRHHNVILAGIMGCPSVAFGATTHKVHGACEWLEGVVGSPYDSTDLRKDVDAIERQARAYVERRADLRRQLQEICERRRSEALELGLLAAGALKTTARTSG
jgi:polysaccharide pyruvyl transferase WcaK-like protein